MTAVDEFESIAAVCAVALGSPNTDLAWVEWLDCSRRDSSDFKAGELTVDSRLVQRRPEPDFEVFANGLLYPPVDIPRPTTRDECRGEARPCPWVACKHHLYLDINPETGSIKINFPDLEPWELSHTCALDVAERGGITLEEVGEIMNLTRERIRQVEVRGLLKLKMGSPSPDELGSELLAQAALAKLDRN